MCQSLFFSGLKACNFIKKRLQHNFFPVNITKFLKSTYFEEHLRMAASVTLIIYRANMAITFNFTPLTQKCLTARPKVKYTRNSNEEY